MWLRKDVERLLCATVLRVGRFPGGFGLRHSPLRCRGGLRLCHSPLRCRGGLRLCHSPLRCRGGLRLCHSLLWEGFGLRHSPLRCRGGFCSPCGLCIPHPPRRRGPCNSRKKTQRTPFRRPLFFVPRPFTYKSKLLTLGPGTKKALKRCLRAFFWCCGERGIRTPGTVTRTSV